MSKKLQTADDLAVLIASGVQTQDAAKQLGISASHAYHVSTEAGFKERVDHLRQLAIGVAIGRLSELASLAVQNLAELSTSADSESVRLKASSELLIRLESLDEHFNVARRIEALEAAATQAELRVA